MYKNIFIFFLTFSMSVSAQNNINIVPAPASLEMAKQAGTFIITKNTPLVLAGTGLDKTAEFFNDYLNQFYGFRLKISKNTTAKNAIILNYERLDHELPGAYTMEVNTQGISIGGDNGTGAFYGIQTLIQLLPIERSASLPIPFLTINDHPRFAYRGMHLDVGRHFMPVAFVKKYIDYLAMHKLNNFHWHLTEDQGWRIEIKKYPLLTQVGSCRAQTLVGRYGSNKYDGKKYCGFYTQEQIKEVVKYATDRYINVIPEIEMPGHAMAAISAYPELSCTPAEPKKAAETWGVFEDVFCPTENTFIFLQNVLDEVIALFPSKYIHIGGDESPKEAWKKSEFCQQLIKEKGLKDEHGLQSYFIQRIEKYLNGKGRQIIGWDEILEGGLAPNATVMSWRGEEGGIEAAKQGHDVIMTPGSHVYFDHSQTKNEDSVTIGGYLPLEKVYSYQPIPEQLNTTQAKHILGAQANVWTEYMKTPSKVEYMVFPRMSALSEVLWSPKEKRDWKNFEERLPAIMKRYELWKANYSKAYYDLHSTVLPTENNEGVYWQLETKDKEGKVIVTSNAGTAPFTYSKPVLIKSTGSYTATLKTKDNKILNNGLNQKFLFNKATGKKITLATPPAAAYPGNGAFTLVDGVQNEKGLGKSSEILGFNGKNLDATIDLGENIDVSKITVHVMDQGGSWVYLPSAVEITYLTSLDDAGSTNAPKQVKAVDPIKEQGAKEIVIESKQKCRYLHIVVKNFGIIPTGLQGASHPAWLFVDEIVVE